MNPIDENLERLRAEYAELASLAADLGDDPEQTLLQMEELAFWAAGRLEEIRLVVGGKSPHGPAGRAELAVEIATADGWEPFTAERHQVLTPGARVRTIGRSDRPAWILVYARRRADGPALRAVHHAPGPHDAVRERTIEWEVEDPGSVPPESAFVRFELRADAWRTGGWSVGHDTVRVPYRRIP